MRFEIVCIKSSYGTTTIKIKTPIILTQQHIQATEMAFEIRTLKRYGVLYNGNYAFPSEILRDVECVTDEEIANPQPQEYEIKITMPQQKQSLIDWMHEMKRCFQKIGREVMQPLKIKMTIDIE